VPCWRIVFFYIFPMYEFYTASVKMRNTRIEPMFSALPQKETSLGTDAPAD
jgi:hypothetical protein